MHYARNIILDFDGTIFQLFVNHNLNSLISKICEFIKEYDINFNEKNDAFDIFERINVSDISEELKSILLRQIQIWFIEEEIKALNSGILIDGFEDFIQCAFKNNKKVAVASNNSKECIEKFLEKFEFGKNKKYYIPIVGRDGQHPGKMKPDPYMLEAICKNNSWSECDTVYVGDHPRDYECAMRFGCDFIGMTPTEIKKERLIKYAPSITTVDNFFELIKIIE